VVDRPDEVAVAEYVTAIIDRVGARAAEVIESIQGYLATEIVELRGDPALLGLLGGSVAGNVETVFDALRYRIAIERVEPPTAALEYARRVAQHGIPANALVRAYRLGHQRMLSHVGAEIRAADLGPDAELAVYESISSVTFQYIDWISQQVTEAYETERERWLESRNSVRAVRVRELLELPADQVGQTDVDAMTTAVRYPLRGNHLAVILWADAGDDSDRELLRLERYLRELADCLKLSAGPLFVAADRVSGWGWLPLGPDDLDPVERIRAVGVGDSSRPHLALGTVASGVDGFRRSHRQARQAQAVANAGGVDRPLYAAGDPGVLSVALFAENVADTRDWVYEVLGPLADGTDNNARLRETLRVFLAEGASYKAAAERLSLHHNSVKYRIDRAVERRGRPIGTDRIDVELALLACHHLGSAVLRPVEPGKRSSPTDRCR